MVSPLVSVLFDSVTALFAFCSSAAMTASSSGSSLPFLFLSYFANCSAVGAVLAATCAHENEAAHKAQTVAKSRCCTVWWSDGFGFMGLSALSSGFAVGVQPDSDRRWTRRVQLRQRLGQGVGAIVKGWSGGI